VKIAFSIGIGKHKDRVEVAILPGRVEPGAGIKANGRTAKACAQIVQLLFEGSLFFSGESWIACLSLVAKHIFDAHSQLVEHTERMQLRIDKAGAHQGDQLFIAYSQTLRERFYR